MAKQIEETLGLILESAEAEFLEKGYESASLRTIAQKAGVTTGALYVRFENKDALFSALVEPIAEQILLFLQNGNTQGVLVLKENHPEEMWYISDEIIERLLDYVYDNKIAFDLLLNCSSGSSYENFMEDMIHIEEESSYAYLQNMQTKGFSVRSISKIDLHILMSAQYYAFFEVIRHESNKDTAKIRVRTVVDFFRPGWKGFFTP